ncbi:MAG TPA: FkbM family methyltransferase [Mucilaginibacter sp.]|nr:FkbM family methyltransferase [Mucilaginibacter sp.]
MIFNGSNLLTKMYLFYSRKVFNHPMKLRFMHFLHRNLGNHIKFEGYGAVLQPAPADFITRKIIVNGCYEPLSLQLALDILKEKKGAFVDIGANIGLYTAVVARNFPDIPVISIEADETNFNMLVDNIRLNHTGNVTALNIAIGDSAKLVQLEQAADNNSGTIRVSVDTKTEGRYVAMLDLATVLGQVCHDHIRLMKMDIEGYEMQALKGMNWTRHKPENILLEFSDYINRAGDSCGEMLNMLYEQGYEACSVNGKPYITGSDLPESNLWLKLKT